MSQIVGLAIIVSFAVTALADLDHPAVNITIADTIPDYTIQYPNAEVTKVTNIPTSFAGWTLFQFGKIEAGDIHLARAVNVHTLHIPQDVSMEVKYPSPHNMAVISRMDLWVTIDSNPSNYCYITSNGTGNSAVSAWIESKATKRFSYYADFFGHKAVEYLNTNIQIADKIEDYSKLYPLSKLTVMQKTKYDNGTVLYSLGNRSGSDMLVSMATADNSILVVQDFALSLNYPQINKDGAIITCIEVLLTETNPGKATGYIVSGGLGKSYMKAFIQSTSSKVFNYDAKIYGYFHK